MISISLLGISYTFLILSMVETVLQSSRSASVRAVMASTTTTARGTMTGSCLPWMEMSISSPASFTVCCVAAMEGVGLTAARNIRSEPSLMPPKVPPEWLVFFTVFPSLMQKGSLLVLPTEWETAKPSPISTPFTAPMDIIA